MTVLGVLSVAWFGILFGAIWGFVLSNGVDPWMLACIGGLAVGALTTVIGYSWRVDQ